MGKNHDYVDVEQACCVMDSVCDSPALPANLYDGQKKAWKYIREHIQSISCSHEFISGPFLAVCIKCKKSFPSKLSI